MDVDDRKLRARHGVLRHDQRGPRLVLADVGGGIRLASLGRAAADLTGRQLLRRRRAQRERIERDERKRFRRSARSQAVSRILSAVARPCGRATAVTTIPLAPPLLAGSSDLPGGFDGHVRQRRSLGKRRTGRPQRLPIWSCSVRGFACHPCYHGRGALLPHLFTLTRLRGLRALRRSKLESLPRRSPRSGEGGRYIFCATFLQVAPTGRYPAHCPAEFGLSSRLRAFGASAASPPGSLRSRRSSSDCSATSDVGCVPNRSCRYSRRLADWRNGVHSESARIRSAATRPSRPFPG